MYVLTYNAPHRKTQDLLFRLKMKGYDNVVVLAVPGINRKNFVSLIPHRHFNVLDVNPIDICDKFQYEFVEIKMKELLTYFENNERDLVLYAGAGILPADVVNSVEVINSHPAYLPFTRGLDSYKWAIYYNNPLGVSTHIMAEEVDAGMLIKRKLLNLYSWDTFHSAANRQYELEVDMLVDSIDDMKTSDFIELDTNSVAQRRMPNFMEGKMLEKFKEIISNIPVSDKKQKSYTKLG